MTHRTMSERSYHGATSCSILAGMRNSSMGPPHEGSIQRPIARRANTLTTELHLAPPLGIRDVLFTHTPPLHTSSLTRLITSLTPLYFLIQGGVYTRLIITACTTESGNHIAALSIHRHKRDQVATTLTHCSLRWCHVCKHSTCDDETFRCGKLLVRGGKLVETLGEATGRI